MDLQEQGAVDGGVDEEVEDLGGQRNLHSGLQAAAQWIVVQLPVVVVVEDTAQLTAGQDVANHEEQQSQAVQQENGALSLVMLCHEHHDDEQQACQADLNAVDDALGDSYVLQHEQLLHVSWQRRDAIWSGDDKSLGIRVEGAVSLPVMRTHWVCWWCCPACGCLSGLVVSESRIPALIAARKERLE